MLFGAHNSIAGGLHHAPEEAKAMGADVMQMFCKNQRQFRATPIEPEDVRRFQQAVKEAGLQKVMVHDSYIINLGNPDDGKRAFAAQAFRTELERCEALGVDYLNFHPGAHMHPDKRMRDDAAQRNACIDRIADELNAIAGEVPGRVKLVIENAAGQGTNVGHRWEEVGRLADGLHDQQRIGVCVDTQHAWAGGYDFVDAYDEVWEAFDDQVGLKRLVAFHLNDSKMPCGARVDRHDNIGRGHLGRDLFERLVNDPRFRGVPGFLETEGGPAMWVQEIAFLRALQQGGPPAVLPGAAMQTRKGRSRPLPALSGSARTALEAAGIRSLADLARRKEVTVAAIPGVGGQTMAKLRDAMAAAGLRFR